MNHCYVEFRPKDSESLQRTKDFFGMIKAAKQLDDSPQDTQFLDFLSENERSYFWNPTPEEQAAWSKHWFSTPIEIRHSPQMLMPKWQFGSMLDSFWQGDYELDSIKEDSGRHLLTFNPNGYPFGGTGCMAAMLESFGHKVIGTDDGTGYEVYTLRTAFWQPTTHRPWWKFWQAP